jgi:hypothetical protein
MSYTDFVQTTRAGNVKRKVIKIFVRFIRQTDPEASSVGRLASLIAWLTECEV